MALAFARSPHQHSAGAYAMKTKMRPGIDKVEQQMTPMIDIVFQLLTFFVMSFKIAAAEGDFNVKMPTGAPNSQEPNDLPPIRVRLLASEDGNLSGIQISDRPLQDFDELHREVLNIAGPNSGPGST